ncbi:ChaN family lipoprotein [Hydrogenophaga sp.]|uniref:ChaN family lipoprotein n=1 Tax=Hydrogenophaga sp. TaxID=1904254 RepID=UPI003D102B1E
MNRTTPASLLLISALLVACAHPKPSTVTVLLDRVLPTPVLMLGEQHDAPEHQVLQREVVQLLAAQGKLAALIMEMVEQGHDTLDLPRDANEARVREALAWSERGGWPWPTYGPVVMAAVRNGVPVIGGNLPRARMRDAMGNGALDDLVGEGVLRRQRDGIRDSHCGLLPEGQITPMTRIQLARDQALAQTVAKAVTPGKTVLLVAGNGHVRRDLGVPLHLPSSLAHKVVMAQAGAAADSDAPPADTVWVTPALPPRDHCTELRQRLKH